MGKNLLYRPPLKSRSEPKSAEVNKVVCTVERNHVFCIEPCFIKEVLALWQSLSLSFCFFCYFFNKTYLLINENWIFFLFHLNNSTLSPSSAHPGPQSVHEHETTTLQAPNHQPISVETSWTTPEPSDASLLKWEWPKITLPRTWPEAFMKGEDETSNSPCHRKSRAPSPPRLKTPLKLALGVCSLLLSMTSLMITPNISAVASIPNHKTRVVWVIFSIIGVRWLAGNDYEDFVLMSSVRVVTANNF